MNQPRVLFAGTSSGSGKTTAVCTVLSLLKRRGIGVRSCKCGPDYIDPMFHRSVLGIPCTNLDPFFCDENLLQYLLGRNAGERLTVIEGVMGYYDGTGVSGTDNSTFTVAAETQTPVILIVSAKGAAASLLAVIEGFLRFVPESRITGVLFDRISPMNYKNVTRLMQDRFGDTVTPVGFIPELPEECRIPSRHLGLVTADEILDLSRRLDRTADLCEKTVDPDRILALADTAGVLSCTAPEIPVHAPVRIAVARDAAFCFYYSETLQLLEEMGAELCPFSPLADEPVPEAADGLLLGGGYPELYAAQLEAARTARDSVAAAIRGGMPTVAECGGFQYLGRALDGHAMCGALPHESADAGKLVRFGYCTLTARRGGLLGPAGMQLRAHEFHYWDSTENGGAFRAEKPSGRGWDCAVMTETLYAGYPHLYFCSCIPAADAFYRKCLAYKEDRR